MNLRIKRYALSVGNWAALVAMGVLGACTHLEQAIASQPREQAIPPDGAKVELALTGYNYTNRHIEQFRVNATGGGNLYVSSPTSGGGGTACCVSYIIGAKKWRVRVRWQTDACTFNNETFSNGEQDYEVFRYFKEVEVDVSPAIPARPNFFEVHFYPDGHVEAAVTEQGSRPRLLLPKEREDKTPYRRCPNDERPKV